MTERKLDLERAFTYMNFPKVHEGAKLSNIPDHCRHKKHLTKIVEDIRSFVNNGDNLFLWGDFGYGKSASAAIMLKAALSKGFVGFWMTHENYVGSVMNNVWYSGDLTVSDRCREVPILVIDELLLRHESKQKEMMIESLIRDRLEKKRSTVITSNHSPAWMKEHHQSLQSLLRGHFLVMKCEGHDFRGE